MRFGGFGPRYAAALAIDAIGAGLLRPFLVLYGVSVLGLPASATGLALSAGLLAGLVAVPLTGRWIDAGARTAPVAATLLVRVAGVAVLLAAHGVWAFALAALLLGIGNQAWPPAHAALVAALADGPADAPLAFGRSLRNAGLGAGALIAAACVGFGPSALRLLAFGTAAGYAAAAVLVLSMRTMRLARPPQEVARAVDRRAGAGTRELRLLVLANLPLALCYSVLEVVLPVILTERLHAGAAWSGLIFAGNTVLVVALQVPLVVWLGGRSRRLVLAGSGAVLAVSYLGFWAAGDATGVAVVAVLYTVGEILYAGSGTALVAATARPAGLGRALAAWQASTGVANAVAPALLLALLGAGGAPLWITLVGGTLAGALLIARFGPVDTDRAGRAELSGCAAEGAAAAAGAGGPPPGGSAGP
ncbi:MAG TPA: MFS transporter [Dactylosporangium sp.]|nr:MFS transporter [Dactylosporangium sp.]